VAPIELGATFPVALAVSLKVELSPKFKMVVFVKEWRRVVSIGLRSFQSFSVYFTAASVLPQDDPVAYLDVDTIIKVNRWVLDEVRVRKADRHQVLSKSKIQEVLDKVVSTPGDIYDKAVTLLVGLATAHPFASGNRRTAFVSTVLFLMLNGITPVIKYRDDSMVGIREGFYTREEIKSWLKGDELRPFKRFEH